MMNSNENIDEELRQYVSQETQTKLFAILLPECPLIEMKSTTIETRTSINLTQACQVNTLSYLIKTNENESDLQHSKDDKNENVDLSSTLFFHIKNPVIKVLSSEEEKMYEDIMTLKCINACDTIDLDESNISIVSSQSKHTINPEHKTSFNIHNLQYTNNSEQLTSTHVLSVNYQIARLYRLITRKRRENKNKKRVYGFLQRLYRHRQSNIAQLLSSKQNSSPTIHSKSHLSSTHQRQQSIINLNLNNFDNIPQYNACDHAIIIKTSKQSTTCKQLQTLLNNPDTILEELIDLQLQLTSNNNSKSVCILIDNHKQSEQSRSLFLHYIYTTLSNTLKKIINQDSIQITCMNLAFFNNSICDIINMQRLRLIDTGK